MQVRAILSIVGIYQADNNIFNALQLPDGIDAETLRDTILLDCAELEIIYPNPDVMRLAMVRWSAARRHEWGRMVRALTEEYNPLHNFDRHEESDDENSATGSSSNTATNWVQGYNDEAEQGRSAGSSGATNKGTSKHRGHLYGNIGVTKSGEMIRDELEIRATDIYHIISAEFRDRFCVEVY